MLKVHDLVRITIRQHLRQRSLGVVLSIAFGVCVYLVVSIIGRDLEDKIVQDVNLIGKVALINMFFEESTLPGTPLQTFHASTVDALREDPRIVSVSTGMHYRDWSKSYVENRQYAIGVLGVDEQFWNTNDVTAGAGRLFAARDVRERGRICVLGPDTASILFGEGPYVGRMVTLRGENYEVIGVARGAVTSTWPRTSYIPLTTAMDRGFQGASPNHIFLKVGQIEDVEALAGELPEFVGRFQSNVSLRVEYAAGDVVKLQTVIMWVRLLLFLGIGASLILGALGIWQGAFAAVRERTREIGLKLAMGAERRDIMAEFLAESFLKSLVGGVTGFVLGTGGIFLATQLIAIDLSWAELLRTGLASLVAASLVGMLAGLYPALYASRLDVVQALRYE